MYKTILTISVICLLAALIIQVSSAIKKCPALGNTEEACQKLTLD